MDVILFDELRAAADAPAAPWSDAPCPRDRAVVWTVRRLTACPDAHPLVLRVWSDLLGPARAAAFSDALDDLVAALAAHGRRRLRVGRTGWAAPTEDEALLLDALDAAAVPPRLDAHLDALVHRAGRARVRDALCRLADLTAELAPPGEQRSLAPAVRHAAE
jgi:hypothetical protein